MDGATRTVGTRRSRGGILLAIGALGCALASSRSAEAACDGGEAELNEAIGAALGAWTSANRAVYTRARVQVEACLNETREVLAPETVAAWFRFHAVDTLFQRKDVPGARLALAASNAVAPDFAWDQSVLAGNSDLPPMIADAKALPAGEPVALAQDEGLRTYVNGQASEVRPALLPVLLQVEAPSIGVLQTRVLAPGEDWAPTETPGYALARAAWTRRQERGRRAVRAGGALLGSALVVGGGATVGGLLLAGQTEAPESLTRGVVLATVGQVGAGVLAGAGLATLSVGVGMRW